MKFFEETRKYPNCRVCLGPLLDVAGMGVHPLCDKSPDVWWTPEEMDAWLTEREAAETGPESHGDARTPPAASEET